MQVCFEPRRAAGFTLIELMVTLVVATILIAIAVITGLPVLDGVLR